MKNFKKTISGAVVVLALMQPVAYGQASPLDLIVAQCTGTIDNASDDSQCTAAIRAAVALLPVAERNTFLAQVVVVLMETAQAQDFGYASAELSDLTAGIAAAIASITDPDIQSIAEDLQETLVASDTTNSGGGNTTNTQVDTSALADLASGVV